MISSTSRQIPVMLLAAVNVPTFNRRCWYFLSISSKCRRSNPRFPSAFTFMILHPLSLQGSMLE